ncbi:hypothetical protein Tco_0812703 [Tanacetum coccineum]
MATLTKKLFSQRSFLGNISRYVSSIPSDVAEQVPKVGTTLAEQALTEQVPKVGTTLAEQTLTEQVPKVGATLAEHLPKAVAEQALVTDQALAAKVLNEILISALIERLVSLATSGMIESKSELMKTSLESRFKNVKEGTKLLNKDLVFKDRMVMNIVALGVKKEYMQVQVIGHVLNVAASAMTPDGPNALSGSVDIEKEIFYDAKRVTWDLTYGYLRVTFPFGTADTMLQGPFSVPWAPYQDPTIEKASAAADQDGGHEKKDGGHGKKDGGQENVDRSGTI